MQKLHDTCTVDGCDREHHARGVCITHYARLKRGVTLDRPVRPRTEKPPECTEEDCDKPVKANGLCGMHLQRTRRHGSTAERLRQRPYKKCSIESCTRPVNSSGYCEPHYQKHRKWSPHGLTVEGFYALLEAQGGVCAVCKKPETSTGSSGAVKELAIDHCHGSGAIRGLLCSTCNQGLGYFKDDKTLLLSAISYLTRFEDKQKKAARKTEISDFI